MKNKSAVVIASILLVIVLIAGVAGLIPVLVKNSRLRSANAAYESQNYAEAVALLQEGDELWPEANRKAGEAAHANQDYEAALSYFENLGADGDSSWLHSKCSLILEQATPDHYQDAWAALDELLRNGKNQAVVSEYQVRLLRSMLQAENPSLPQMEQLAAQIPRQNAPGMAELYYDLGCRWLQQEDLEFYEATAQALPHFNSGLSPKNAKTLSSLHEQLVKSGYYYAAASLVRANRDSISLSNAGDLHNMIANYISDKGFVSLEHCLHADFALELSYDAIEDHYEESPEDVLRSLSYRTDSMYLSIHSEVPQGYEYNPKSSLQLPSAEEIESRCGKTPAGKILFLIKERIYKTDDEVYTIPMGLMTCLPKEVYPMTLEEVEYIICISADYVSAGRYDNGSAALRTTAQVQVLHPADGSVSFSSPVIKGGKPPRTIHYFSPPPFVPGSSPDIGSIILEAYQSIVS